MDFEDKLKEAFKMEFDSVEFSEKARISVMEKTNKNNVKTNIISRILNYEIEISLRSFVAAVILIVLAPTIAGIVDIKNNEKKYLDTRIIMKSENR